MVWIHFRTGDGLMSISRKLSSAGGTLGGGGVSEFSFVAIEGNTSSTTATVPSSAQVGDLCIIFSIGVSSGAPATPSGWSQIYRIDGPLFSSRGIYKVLTPGEAGTSVIVNSATNVSVYGATISLVIRGDVPVTNVYVSSLTSQGETNTTVSASLDTSEYAPPNILIAAKSDFNKTYSSYSTALSGSFWGGGLSKTATIMALAACYEIQNSSNTDRTASPTTPNSSSYQHMHSFVLNAE